MGSSNRPKSMLSIRKATNQDAPLILDFIRRLAEYEREPQAAVATEADLLRDGFRPGAEISLHHRRMERTAGRLCFFLLQLLHMAWPSGAVSGRPVCAAELRGHGIGKALLQELAQIAVNEHCYGIRWMVLEWNEPALKFYESLGRRSWVNGKPCCSPDRRWNALPKLQQLECAQQKAARPKSCLRSAKTRAVRKNDEAQNHRRRPGRL